MQLRGTSAIVTGAASGLGAATAAALAGAGATVIGVDLPAGWERSGDVPAGVTRVDGDVTSADDVSAAVTAATGTGAPLRIAVNCAGVAWASRILGRKGVHDLDLFAKVVGINLVGTFNVLRLAAEAMAQTDPVAEDTGAGQRGLIVNTASVAAFDGQVGQIAYSASKGGIAAMTLPAARDLAQHGIRVMAIAPGIMDTPMMASITEEFRLGLEATVPFPARFGRPDEYAALVLSIAEQDYLNGEVIRFDGALRMPPR
jgi:NAD(P)-dependent dehydrogenase (short-subunit alcohol dehydrogenase family)